MTVKIFNPETKEEHEYFLDHKLIYFGNKAKKRVEKTKDKDLVVLVDGQEGCGKSVFTMQLAKYIDPTLSLKKICFSAEEFKNAIINSKKGECIIYDEAVTGLTGAESLTKVGRLLKSMMMQMRQKNLVVFIVIPSFFELNKYSVLSRAKFLFHVYENKGVRGFWSGYNSNKLRNLYIKGKRTNSYFVKTMFKGLFRGKYVVNEEEYRKKKEISLFEADSTQESHLIERYKRQRDCLAYLFHRYIKSFDKIEDFLQVFEFPLTKSTLCDTNTIFKAKETEYIKKVEEIALKHQKAPKSRYNLR